MTVDPAGADLKAFLHQADDGPFVMLNLLRFTDAGRPSYEEYSREVAPYLRRVGGRLLYAGDMSTALVAPDGFTWDAILLVSYPTRAAFCDMVADPDYQQFTHLRTKALSHAVLQATTPWGGSPPAE